MTTPPIPTTTDDLIAELERFASDAEIADDEWISGFTAGDFRALLAERADLKQQLVAAGITADNCELFRKDAERWQMMVVISDEATIAPDYRKNQASLDAYINAVGCGLYLEGAVDAAISAAMHK